MFNKMGATLMAVTLTASMAMPVFAGNPNNVPTFDASSSSIITKTVTADDGVTFTGESFTYAFAQGELNTTDSGVTANQKKVTIPDITISDASSSAVTPTEDADGNKVYTFTKGAIDLSALDTPGVYTFTVTESARTATDPDGTTWAYDTGKYLMRVYVEKDGNGNLSKNMTLKKLDAAGAETGDKLTTAQFDNTLTKTASFLRIAKLANNDAFADNDEEYTFVVTFDEGTLNTAPEGGYAYTITDGTTTYGTGTIKSGETITMKKNQYAEFKTVPAGTEVTVTETNLASNVDKVTATALVGSTSLSGDAYALTGNKTPDTLVDENGTSITFTNTWKDVTVTGIVTNVAPYVALVALIGAAAAAYAVMKKRIAR